jgi:transposase-like protein
MRKPRKVDENKEKYWRQMLAAFQRGGLPFREFCRRENISPNTFQFWRRELRKRDEARGVTSTVSKGDNRPSKLQQNIDYWLRIIDEINSHDGSVNSYCRSHHLSSGSLHYWEKRLREMKLTNGVRRDQLKERNIDYQPAPTSTPDHAKTQTVRPAAGDDEQSRAGASGKHGKQARPTFVSLELSPETVTASGASQPIANYTLETALSAGQLAAELLHARSGCQVRIFNGADRPTLAALVAALSVGQSIEF